MMTRYPEVRTLHSFAYLRTADLLEEDVALSEPELHDVFHRFLQRVAEHADVRRGRAFVEQAYGLQRAVYVEAFRNAYHDALRHAQAAARLRRRKEERPAENEVRVVDSRARVPESRSRTSDSGEALLDSGEGSVNLEAGVVDSAERVVDSTARLLVAEREVDDEIKSA